MDHHHTIQLQEPITVLKHVTPRHRGAINGPADTPITLTKLDVWITLNTLTRQVWAYIAHVSHPLMLWGPEDFAAVASDLPEQHAERVMQILGSDIATSLQSLINGDSLPPAPPRVPREIPNWRAKAVLAQMGLLDAVTDGINALPEPDRTVAALAWAGDAKLARYGKTVLALAPRLSLADKQVDQLFIAAEAIEV